MRITFPQWNPHNPNPVINGRFFSEWLTWIGHCEYYWSYQTSYYQPDVKGMSRAIKLIRQWDGYEEFHWHNSKVQGFFTFSRTDAECALISVQLVGLHPDQPEFREVLRKFGY